MNLSKHPRGMLICFTGIDGAGKSTLARTLVGGLNQRGFSFHYVYARFQPCVLKPFSAIGRLLFLRGKDMHKNYVEYRRATKTLFENKLLAAGYEWVLLLDYFAQVTYKIRLPLARGENIVCDRYVYDTVINDLAVLLNFTDEKLNQTLSLCVAALPRPDLTFLVDAPPEIAWQRKNDIPSISYLTERRMIYKRVAEEHNMTILDGTRQLEELRDKTIRAWDDLSRA